MRPPNDWKIEKTILASILLLLDTVSLIGMNIIGFDFPLLLQLVGFVFLIFVPGFLMLKILRIHGIGWGESTMYAIGLSLALEMFTGLFINTILQWFGISKPISIIPITVSMFILTIILMALAYKRDNTYIPPAQNFTIQLSLFNYFLLILIPSMAIGGALLVRYQENPFILIIFLLFVAVIVGLITSERILDKKLYPLFLLVISISLLMHISLSSSQLIGSDIHLELYYLNFTMHEGYWDPGMPGSLNTALSIMILNPIYSLILDMSSISVIKIIYTIVFAFIPLILFYVYQTQMNPKGAFFSSLLIIFTPMFITSELGGARNQIGLLYFTLMLLLMMDSKLEHGKKAVLAIIFASALPLSHYGTASVFALLLSFGWLIYLILQYSEEINLWKKITSTFNRLFKDLSRGSSNSELSYGFNENFIILYLVIMVSWFLYISSGGVFRMLTYNVAYKTFLEMNGIFSSNSYLEPLGGAAIGLDWGTVSILGKAFRIFQYIIQLFIAIGLLRIILKPEGFKKQYIALTIAAALIWAAILIIPHFSVSLGIPRLYFIGLLILSPLFLLGGEVLWYWTYKLLKQTAKAIKKTDFFIDPINNSKSISVFTLIVLIPYFLISSGFFFEISGSTNYGVMDSPSSPALSSHRIYMPIFNTQEAVGVVWTKEYNINGSIKYSDLNTINLLIEYIPTNTIQTINSSGEMTEEGYIFLGTWNIEKDEFNLIEKKYIGNKSVSQRTIVPMQIRLHTNNLIYNNGGSHLLYYSNESVNR